VIMMYNATVINDEVPRAGVSPLARQADLEHPPRAYLPILSTSRELFARL